MPVEKSSVIDNKYTIRQVDRSLTTKILGSDLARFKKRPQVLGESNLLNHWVDTSDYDSTHPDDEIVYSTTLGDDEHTLSEFRAASHSYSLMDFKDAMLPALKAVLEFAYYQEKDKQWETPLNPLNLILQSGEDENGEPVINVKSFYRYPRVRETIDSNYLDSVVKIAAYLLSPEEQDSVGNYDKLTAQDYADGLDNEDIKMQYGDDVDEYADFFYLALSPETGENFFSVKDMLENIGADDAIARVDNPNNHGGVGGLIGSGVNLSDYQQSPEADAPEEEEQEEAPEKPLSKKEQRQKQLEEERKQLEEQKAKKKEQKEADKANGGKQKKKHHTFLILALLALIAGGGYYAYHKHQEQVAAQQRQQQQQAAQSSNQNDPMSNSTFKAGMNATSAGNYQQATDDFNNYFSNNGSNGNLSEQEIAAVFNAYLHTSNYQKILDNIGSPDTAWSLVEYLQSQNQMDKINGLHSSQPLIKFIQADNKHDQNGMVSAGKNNVNLHGNKQWEDDLCNAFAQTNKLKQGKEWAENQNNSKQLIQSIKAHAYQAKKEPYDKINKTLD